ncbi:hypothetical protein RB195_001278 [Necator americanus]|uniref:Paired domain-containing protein n=1 Tax=Necator americanus TaxID=51031 RepID=A0ABR1DDH7_NECAM
MDRTFGARHMSIETRKSILRGIDQGMRQVELAKLFNVSRATISAFLKRVSTCGVIGATPNPGRSRMTTRVIDRNILRMSRANPSLTASDIQSELAIANQQIPSVRTVRRRLQDAGLNGRRPAKKPLISKKYRVARVKWAKEHIGSTRQQWNKVLFSDESKFNLMGSDGINSHGVGPLRRIHGSLDRYGYEKILETTMRPFALQIISRGFIFQQDNDPKHTPSYIRDWFNRRHVEVLDWPSQSPDLNPIEHLWEELEPRMKGKKARNSAEKFAQFEEAWNAIPQSCLDNLLDSMPRRCQAVIDAKGFATKY